MRLRAFGLRPRFLAALLLTSAVTLAVAALTLLSPLESRLRTDGVASVLTAVSASKPEFDDIRTINGAPDVTQLQARARELRRRAGARVIVVDRNLTPLYSTSPADADVPDNFSDVRRALQTNRLNHSLNGDDLKVADTLKIGDQTYGLAVRRRINYVSATVRSVRNAFLVAAGVGLGIALLLGIGLTTTMLRRLERLRDATRELEREGLDAPAPQDGGRDEIGELTRAFASMQMRLRRQEAARRAFVATASHELRTPLASLDGMLELLEDDLTADNLDLEDARERTARAKEQSQRLSRLATDLLDLSRLDAEVELRSEPIELGEISRAVVAEFEMRASAQGVALEVEQSFSPCWVAADPGAVARIIRILLDNALRVAPPGYPIRVEMTCGKRWASATVSDRGPGVVADEHDLIFERFQRGSATAGGVGFGLGLAIGRELATRMGGSLELEHGPPSPRGTPPGARFALRLPVAAENMNGAP